MNEQATMNNTPRRLKAIKKLGALQKIELAMSAEKTITISNNTYITVSMAIMLVSLTAFVIGKFSALENGAERSLEKIERNERRIDAFETKYMTKDETMLRFDAIKNDLEEIKHILTRKK